MHISYFNSHPLFLQASFSAYSPESLVQWEREILSRIDFYVCPAINPTCFVEVMLAKCQDKNLKEKLRISVNDLVSRFLEGSDLIR